jgi:hypothetical protein
LSRPAGRLEKALVSCQGFFYVFAPYCVTLRFFSYRRRANRGKEYSEVKVISACFPFTEEEALDGFFLKGRSTFFRLRRALLVVSVLLLSLKVAQGLFLAGA